MHSLNACRSNWHQPSALRTLAGSVLSCEHRSRAIRQQSPELRPSRCCSTVRRARLSATCVYTIDTTQIAHALLVWFSLTLPQPHLWQGSFIVVSQLLQLLRRVCLSVEVHVMSCEAVR